MRILLRLSRVSWCRLRVAVATRKVATPRSRGFSTELGSSIRLTEPLRKHLAHLMQQYSALVERANSRQTLSQDEHRKLYQSLSNLEPIVDMVQELEGKQKELAELEQLAKEADMRSLAVEEQLRCRKEIESLEVALVKALVPRDEADRHSAILEVRAGAGGREAALFTYEIFQMYQRFAVFKKWQFETLETDRSDEGGYKHASASVTGQGVFGIMKHESGVHRVQRVPVTESTGRIHTSTMSVVILPQPTEIEVKINPNDLKVETLRASGAGGQHVNTTDSAVRLTHLPTGIVISIQDERSQHSNKAKALKLLRARLYELRRREAGRERSELRKAQMGTLERSERIRTYNFPQDRVTDHRLGVSVHGVEVFLGGGEELGRVVTGLQALGEALATPTTADTCL